MNFTDIPLLFWRGALPDPPQKMEAFEIQISGVEKQVSAVWLASPDTPSLEAVPAEFVQDEDKLTLTVPALSYWLTIVIEVIP